MPHYFENPKNRAHNRKEITFRFLGIETSLTVDDHIFSKTKPDEGSLLLVEEVLKLHPRGTLCDLGSGYGLMSIVLKIHQPELKITGIEVNEWAHLCALESNNKHNLDINFIQGDALSTPLDQYDWIITNPPIRAGKDVVFGFLTRAEAHLTPEGRLIFVIRRQQGVKSAVNFLQNHFEILNRLTLKKGYEVWMAEKPLTLHR